MTRMRTVRRLGTVTFVGLMAIATAACSAGEDSASSGTVAGGGDTSGSVGEGLGGGTVPAANPGDDGATPGTVVDDRKLIIKVTVGVEVDDVAAAVNQVIGLARAHGGELSASSIDLSNPQFAGGDMVFRIPPAETDAFIAGLDPGIGRRTGLQTDTQDVTLQITDLDTRIENARASLDRVRALLAEAKNIGEVISLESELTQRENTLEELIAQKTYLDQQVAMSTVTVRLSATGVEPTPTEEDTGIGHAFRSGWNGFTSFLGGIAKFIGYTLPFLVLLALAGLIALPIIRRARRNRSAAPLLPPAPAEDQRMSAPGS